MEREEIRKSEWAVEREADLQPYRLQVMPWARGGEDDRFARRSVAAALLVSLLIGLLLPMVDLPIPLREELIEVPERVAKLIREVRTPPPPPVEVQEQKVPEEIPEPEPVLAEEQPPDELPEVTDTPVVAEVLKPDTREQVKSKGILAFRDSFAERASSGPTARLGSQASVRTAGQDAIGRPERSMVTTSASGSSGGINLADISRGIGGGGGHEIGGVAVTRVASSIGGGEGPDRPLSGGQSAGRTDEEIQIVFDRYKAALYRLYNRELRKDPTLRGQLVLRLTIEPDGSVSFCQLQSSDMQAPVLAEQVVDRVRGFDFGAKDDIVAMTIIYPIDFLPAA
jgi:outer membrane biosynthesis protein TonB